LIWIADVVILKTSFLSTFGQSFDPAFLSFCCTYCLKLNSKLPPVLTLLFKYKIHKTPFSQTKTASYLVGHTEWVDMGTTWNPISADLQLSILNNTYALQVHIQTPDVSGTPV
jgi:hypothetical protein